MVEKRNPIYFVRYEDLILDKVNTLMGLFRFLLEIDQVKGTNIETRIKQVIQQGDESSQLYKLKESTLKLNYNKQSFTDS